MSDPTFPLAVRHRGVLTVREVEPAFARTLFQDPEFLDGKGRLGEAFHASGRPLPLAPREEELLVFDLDTRRVSGVVRDARFNLALLPTFQLSLQLSGIYGPPSGEEGHGPADGFKAAVERGFIQRVILDGNECVPWAEFLERASLSGGAEEVCAWLMGRPGARGIRTRSVATPHDAGVAPSDLKHFVYEPTGWTVRLVRPTFDAWTNLSRWLVESGVRVPHTDSDLWNDRLPQFKGAAPHPARELAEHEAVRLAEVLPAGPLASPGGRCRF